MARTVSDSPLAARALRVVQILQSRLAERLADAAVGQDENRSEPTFERVEWLRDAGLHGGGDRLETGGSRSPGSYDRASVNVSQVHYSDDPSRRLSSATALSTIVHPCVPAAPSMHMHISWTEMRDESGYWRLMADLNPSTPHGPDAERFRRALAEVRPELADAAFAQGDRYFAIPTLGRTRGVCHYYLEGYQTGDHEADAEFALEFGEAVIEVYGDILEEAFDEAASKEAASREGTVEAQLAYHTLYLYQVLTLDRGTTAGVLVHDQNDVGIMGSLPSRVDPGLLASWAERTPAPQDALVRRLVEILQPAEDGSAPVDEAAKRRFTAAMREHYAAHPEGLSMQASGDIIPPTVENHRPGGAD